MSVIQCNCYVFKYYYFDCVWKLPSQISHWKTNNKHCDYFSSLTLQCAYFILDFKCSMCLALCLFFSPLRVYRAYKDVLIKRNRCIRKKILPATIFQTVIFFFKLQKKHETRIFSTLNIFFRLQYFCQNNRFFSDTRLYKKVCIHVGRSGGVRSKIEEQLIAILSAGKYSSDFNAKKIVSVARSVPEISSVEWGKVGPFFTQIISWKAFIETSNNGKSKAHNWQISTKKCNLINWNAYLSHESIYFLEGKLLELKNIYSASLILPVEIQDGRLRRRQFSIWHFWHINSLWNTIYCYRELIIMAWYEHLFNA